MEYNQSLNNKDSLCWKCYSSPCLWLKQCEHSNCSCIWTNGKNDLNSTNSNKSCSKLADLHQICWLIFPSHLTMWSVRKKWKWGWMTGKKYFTSDQYVIIKRVNHCEVTRRWLFIPLLGSVCCLSPDDFPFCMLMADCDTVLSIAAYWYHIQKRCIIFSKHMIGYLLLEIFRIWDAWIYSTT